MEINPVLDAHGLAKPGLWYVLSPEEDGPSPRVGHTCCVRTRTIEIESSEDEKYDSESLLIIGGANPDGAFDDAYILDFEKYSWQKWNWSGLPNRYEHSAFIPKHQPDEIVVFGGARKDNNLNDIQILDTESNSWCIALPSGKAPSQRTCHSAAAIGDQLFIFGGGENGAEPVQDNTLHVYNAKENSWLQPTTHGTSPNCRHGHVMVAVKNNLYIHGGMAGTQIFADLWKLETDKMTWCQPTLFGELPCERAAHAGSSFGRNLYIFGGMNVSGALDDLFSLDTESFVWQKIKCDGPPPNCRLDHTMCTVTVTRQKDDKGCDERPMKVKQTFLVVFGGMDTRGEIFDDCLGFLLQDQ